MAKLRYCSKCKELAEEIEKNDRTGDDRQGLLMTAAIQRAGSNDNVCDMCGKPLTSSSSSAALGCLIVILVPVGWLFWNAAQSVREKQAAPPIVNQPAQVVPPLAPPQAVPAQPVIDPLIAVPENVPVVEEGASKPIESAASKDPATIEAEAASKLKLDKGVLARQPDAGKRRLRDLIEKYPGTEAAREAENLLTK